jgi:hypothetical protein
LEAATPPSSGVPFDAVAQRARRRRAARWSVVASAVAVAAVVAGVATVAASGNGDRSGLATKPTPQPQPSHDLSALTRHVACPQRPTAVSPDQLTAFHAVTVVTCGQEPRELPGQGQWLVEVRRIATGGVAALQTAFGRPNEPQPTNVICTDNLIAVPPLILVDGKGQTLTPTAPVNGCHKPQQQFLAAVRAVSWQDVSVRKVRQLVTPQAQASGCPQQFKNMTFDYSTGARASAGGPLFMRTPKSVHVCLYRVTGSDLEVGTFQRGFVPSAADTGKLLHALAGPGLGGSCSAQRKFAAVLSDSGGWATVELGGCWRVARSYPSGELGSADAAAVSGVLTAH